MTDGAGGLVLPSYYSYYDSPVKIVRSDGGVRVWRVSAEDGAWREEGNLFNEIVFAVGGEVFKRSAADFIQDVERYRSECLSGDGPIFALYETAKALVEAGQRERRRMTPTERAIVHGIRRKTFVMFEEQLQREGNPGADPSLGAS